MEPTAPKKLKLDAAVNQDKKTKRKDIVAALIQTYHTKEAGEVDEEFEITVDTFIQLVGKNNEVWTGVQLITETRWKLHHRNDESLKLIIKGQKEKVDSVIKFLQKYTLKLISFQAFLQSDFFADSQGSQVHQNVEVTEELTLTIFNFNQLSGRDNLFLKDIQDFSKTTIMVDSLTNATGLVNLRIAGTNFAVQRVKDFIKHYCEDLSVIYNELRPDESMRSKLHFNHEIIQELDFIYERRKRLQQLENEIDSIDSQLRWMDSMTYYKEIHRSKTQPHRVLEQSSKWELYKIVKLRANFEDKEKERKNMVSEIQGYSYSSLYKKMKELNKHLTEDKEP